MEDAGCVRLLAGEKLIADTTAKIPHPYPDGLAGQWIASHPGDWESGKSAVFALTLRTDGVLIGSMSLMNIAGNQAELGYWIGVEYWNQGYCTEACRCIVQFGFFVLKLQRIHSHHLSRNPASGRVLLKTGFTRLGSGKSVCGYRQLEECIEQYELNNTTR
jgi:RimJ/RimL family protein N-acetyltransferase